MLITYEKSSDRHEVFQVAARREGTQDRQERFVPDSLPTARPTSRILVLSQLLASATASITLKNQQLLRTYPSSILDLQSSQGFCKAILLDSYLP